VRLAYAGESTMESRRVVNEDGSEDNERLKGREAPGDGGRAAASCWEVKGGTKVSSEGKACILRPNVFASSFSCCLNFPIPILAYWIDVDEI
jgi:hypothetical protein